MKKIKYLFLFWFLVITGLPGFVNSADKRENDSIPAARLVEPLPAPPAVEGRVKTVYDIGTGRPVNQSEHAKGYHRAVREIKLGGSGYDTITVNSSISDGRQDLSFIDHTTYFGRVWSLDADNESSYRIIPISGTQFIIISSDSTDTGTVRVMVEGE